MRGLSRRELLSGAAALAAAGGLSVSWSSRAADRPALPVPQELRADAKGASALNPRGEMYTDENIADRLATRNMLDSLRETGQVRGGPSGLTPKDRQAFANQLDRWLTRRQNEST